MPRRGILPDILWRCPKCRGLNASNGAHAPRWVVRDGKPVQVDCGGDLVLPEPKR